MERLIAFLMLLWSSFAHPGLTLETVVESVRDMQNPVEETVPAIPKDSFNEQGQWVKKDPQLGEAPQVMGVFATAHTVNGSKFEALLKLLDETELNAMVIDVKDDYGNITFETGNEALQAMGTTKTIIQDIDQAMNVLDDHEVYPIARIVVFKDSVLAKKKPEWSFRTASGSVWQNGRKESFVNPYVQEIWEYNVDVAKEAVKRGFKEIQFDYVRFPEGFEHRADSLQYIQDERTRVDAVAEFVKYARSELNPLGVRVSVDIFGYAASVPAAEGIGQDFNKISKYVDVICPMVYPSHYSTGWFGSAVPDARPYTTIFGAMVDTHQKLEEIEAYKPVIRPWIQDFTATWINGYIRYDKEEVEAQIQALHDTGIYEFLLWNASNVYSSGVNYDLK